MNILIIGSGGREHCLAWKISQSKLVDNLFAIPGNAGISQIAKCEDIGISKNNFKDILKFIYKNKIDFTVIGPEAPLVDGLVDYLNENNCSAFGPNKTAAKIEGSKVFTKKLCMKYNIPTANAVFFKKSELKDALKFVNNLKDEKFPYVIKADGLAAGKGVIIVKSKEELINALNEFFLEEKFGAAGEEVIIEDFISGFEVSLLCLIDGNILIPLELAQDYKKIFDNDKGGNTGGMGSFSPLPFVSSSLYQKILNKIIFPTFNALKSEGINYKGVLYGGIIIKDDEPFLLEYNCRFGDPETQSILPRLKNDILQLMINCANGNLNNTKLEWSDNKTVCVVIASKGYPNSSSKGDIITGLDEINLEGKVLVFHAGTKKQNNMLVTNGGRVLNIVASAKTFKEARNLVYKSIENIKFDGMQFRKDIALKVEEM